MERFVAEPDEPFVRLRVEEVEFERAALHRLAQRVEGDTGAFERSGSERTTHIATVEAAIRSRDDAERLQLLKVGRLDAGPLGGLFERELRGHGASVPSAVTASTSGS